MSKCIGRVFLVFACLVCLGWDFFAKINLFGCIFTVLHAIKYCIRDKLIIMKITKSITGIPIYSLVWKILGLISPCARSPRKLLMLPWPADLFVLPIDNHRPVSVHTSKANIAWQRITKIKQLDERIKITDPYKCLWTVSPKILLHETYSFLPVYYDSCGMFTESQYFPWQTPVQQRYVCKNPSRGFHNHPQLDE